MNKFDLESKGEENRGEKERVRKRMREGRKGGRKGRSEKEGKCQVMWEVYV